jgi:hypothetical protein
MQCSPHPGTALPCAGSGRVITTAMFSTMHASKPLNQRSEARSVLEITTPSSTSSRRCDQPFPRPGKTKIPIVGSAQVSDHFFLDHR